MQSGKQQLCLLFLIAVLFYMFNPFWNAANTTSSFSNAFFHSGKLEPSARDCSPKTPKKDTTTPKQEADKVAVTRTVVSNGRKYKLHEPLLPQVSWDDVHITIRTCEANHKTKIALSAKTWIKTAEKEINIVTDADDPELDKHPNMKVVNSGCGKTHDRDDLCCKTGTECITFLEADKKWWCHFDDDVYVNTRQLLILLNTLNSSEPVYLGSQDTQMIYGRKSNNWVWNVVENETYYKDLKPWKWHGTINQGERAPYLHFVPGHDYCFSKPLVKMMEPWVKGQNFVKSCAMFLMGEDTALGFIIHHILRVPTTNTNLFHSQHQNQSHILKYTDLKARVTFFYGRRPDKIVPFYYHKPAFDESNDATRFMSVHCVIHPDDEICPKKKT